MTEARWMLYAKKADFDKIAEQYHISPVTARIIRNRGLEDMEDIGRYLYGSVEQLHNPHLLPDMDRAVEILGEKAAEGRRIRIVGDYDIDGVCSTYLLYRALKRIGAEVDYEIPDRIKDGYGINELIIEAAAEDGIDTILTCDNGIAAISQIARAKELGMTVVVTDHHDILTEAGETPEDREILPMLWSIPSAGTACIRFLIYAEVWWPISWCRCSMRSIRFHGRNGLACWKSQPLQRWEM